MREAVRECARLTKELYELVSRPVKQEDRDRVIAEIGRLLDARGRLLPEITPPFSEEECKLGKEMNRLNEKINAGLEKIKAGVAEDIRRVKKTKIHAAKYTNPYESLQTDGIFYDKRN